jgi:hypothetical protein
VSSVTLKLLDPSPQIVDVLIESGTGITETSAVAGMPRCTFIWFSVRVVHEAKSFADPTEDGAPPRLRIGHARMSPRIRRLRNDADRQLFTPKEVDRY